MSTPEQRRSGAMLFARVFDLGPLGDTDSNPVTRLCNLILTECTLSGFTQIQVCPPEGDGAPVQYGHGQDWKDVMKVPTALHSRVVNRFKVMANLDVGRRPTQDGVITVRRDGKETALAITVEVAPTGGERVTIRWPGG